MKQKGIASEMEALLTRDMSQELRDSDLLGRIRDLSATDKTCLIRYIREDMAEDGVLEDGDNTWDKYEDTLPLLTAQDLRARAVKGLDEYRKGCYFTSDQLHKAMKEEFEWLR